MMTPRAYASPSPTPHTQRRASKYSVAVLTRVAVVFYLVQFFYIVQEFRSAFMADHMIVSASYQYGIFQKDATNNGSSCTSSISDSRGTKDKNSKSQALRPWKYRPFQCNISKCSGDADPSAAKDNASALVFPQVIILGAAKAGTSALNKFLHASLGNQTCSKPVEVHFFDQAAGISDRTVRHAVFGNKMDTLHGKYKINGTIKAPRIETSAPLLLNGCAIRQAYHDVMNSEKHANEENKESCSIYVDKTPSYLSQAHLVPQRLVCGLLARPRPTKPPKFLVTLRDPIARAFSQYNHVIWHDDRWVFPKGILSFEEMIDIQLDEWRLLMNKGEEHANLTPEEEHQRFARYVSYKPGLEAFLARSVYILQLEQWEAVLQDYSYLFADDDNDKKPFQLKDHMMVIGNDAMLKDPWAMTRRVLEFCDLAVPTERPSHHVYETIGDYEVSPHFSNTTREKLIDFFRPYNQRLDQWLVRHGMSRMTWAMPDEGGTSTNLNDWVNRRSPEVPS